MHMGRYIVHDMNMDMDMDMNMDMDVDMDVDMDMDMDMDVGHRRQGQSQAGWACNLSAHGALKCGSASAAAVPASRGPQRRVSWHRAC